MGLPLEKRFKTVAEFLDWEATQPEKQEFYNGEVFVSSPATRTISKPISSCATRG